MCSRCLIPVLSLAFLVVGSVPARAAEAEKPTKAPAVVVIKAARLFDGRAARGGPVTVLLEGDRIRAVGKGLEVPAAAKVIDLGDATLMPGLIDAHTHLSGQMEPDFYKGYAHRLRRTTPEKTLRAAVYAERTLAAGFTTVRDVGSTEDIDIGLRAAIEAGIIPGPRVVSARKSLGSLGGHCDPIAGVPYMRFGKESGANEGVAAGPAGFRHAVRHQIKYGATVIKVCATGGVLSLADEVDTPQLTQAEMDALVDEAHRLRRKVAAHAHGAEGAKVAIRAGVDSIEHGTFLDREAFLLMKQKGTFLVPTLQAYESADPARNDFPPAIAEKAAAALAARKTSMDLAIQLGVKIALGTDAGVNKHGTNARELELMVASGMRPLDALVAGTSAAAELLGKDKDVGWVAPGYLADLIAVPGDPLVDMSTTTRVFFVMKGGHVYRHEPPD